MTSGKGYVMLDRNRFAFKEWASVCEALNGGMQSLILRKGGIHEGREGFRVDHDEFWLYPTEFHQQPDVLVPEAGPLLEKAKTHAPNPGFISLRNYVAVEQVIEIREESLLDRLNGLHVWSNATLNSRFHYRMPMLFLLLVRTYRLYESISVPESPGFAGCRSWVELPDELVTCNLTPVLTDTEHNHRVDHVRRIIES